MADKEGNVLAKDYGIGIAPPERPFPVKGHASAGWGMQSRLGQIFADDGRTIMLAFDHGYIMGSTAGLERLDLTIPPLMQYADCQEVLCVPAFPLTITRLLLCAVLLTLAYSRTI